MPQSAWQPTTLVIQPMDAASALELIGWRYDEPYTLYNVVVKPEELATLVASFVDPTNHYYSLKDGDGALVGFCCFGIEAQVPGGDYSSPALDVGVGMRPDLTGQGHGQQFIEAALKFGRETYHPILFRATVAAFNQRSLRACEKAGYRRVTSFLRPSDGREFIMLVCPA